MNYVVSDVITRIKNASLARRRSVVLPYSKLVKEIATVLVKEGFLSEVKEEKDGQKKTLIAGIRYEKRTPVFSDVLLFSKPSLRIYTAAKDIVKTSKRGRGVAILSTSKGVLTGKEAAKKGVGGELLFKIW
ncbi:MAG: 30S ribosomal protein S8 [Candidatus Levybacteria bacterium RIFCSPHIGHO2_12_FULL_38_12]|nr:MAG: 30S ribosomal protein S8 [Candidatus Levybacteria bacterium RIFCSPHIGHO2_01_FULL_38_12]OGH21960.1 MAG: 30S ribosomal protein S8 [Candidatus Levybacteria bacterium RIFCSPHIGHO2_02_FULL_37_18]OGH23032.1 MAG: 30S ribosomal protein S8 [Candidatus Levybacteria bacterium RIFCSPHIGHO2_12_FULL_38_12]OGH33654.1 MAG: 30S ribosomal protein S8 [Candidatus Levybacteria bacterium RIFCSPLOWO2_01_FULL_37_20]OGH44559.1 MAG: 30S ribosomal protein S8 [Candidatus Levybacteria bacterium RIFCSPLOWO2_02_FULL_